MIGGDYVKIEPIAGRLPSQVLGLQLERDGVNLCFIDPATGKRLLTPLEGPRRNAGRRRRTQRADDERRRTEEERRTPDNERTRALAAEAAQRDLAEQNERLHRENEALRGE